MSDTDKNLIDIILAVVTMIGAVVAFVIGLFHWRRSQAWQRAEQLDKFIEKFETDALLKLSTVVLDWNDRNVKFQERDFAMRNDEALLALRDHRELGGEGSEIENEDMFPGEQPHIRDAYDALLAFFNRLELSISTRLIDVTPAQAYFAYWLKRLVTFDRHPDDKNVLNGTTPESMVAKYIRAYGEPASIKKLCEHFGVKASELESNVKKTKSEPGPVKKVTTATATEIVK